MSDHDDQNTEPAFVTSLRSMSTTLTQLQRNLGEFFTLFEMQRQGELDRLRAVQNTNVDDVVPVQNAVAAQAPEVVIPAASETVYQLEDTVIKFNLRNEKEKEHHQILLSLLSDINKFNPNFNIFKLKEPDVHDMAIAFVSQDVDVIKLLAELNSFRALRKQLLEINQGDVASVESLLRHLVIVATNQPIISQNPVGKRHRDYDSSHQHLIAIGSLDHRLNKLLKIQWLDNNICATPTGFNIVVEATRSLVGLRGCLELYDATYQPDYDAMMVRISILATISEILTHQANVRHIQTSRKNLTVGRVYANDASEGMTNRVKDAMDKINQVLDAGNGVSLDAAARGVIEPLTASPPTTPEPPTPVAAPSVVVQVPKGFVDVTSAELLIDIANSFSGSISSQFTGKIAPWNAAARSVNTYPLFREDLKTHYTQINEHWSDGFYTDSVTGDYQFLIKISELHFVVILFNREAEKTRVYVRNGVDNESEDVIGQQQTISRLRSLAATALEAIVFLKSK